MEAFEMWCWRKMLSISWQEHRTNDSILTELGLERVNGNSGEAETTIFWPHYSGKCRTVGTATYSPRRNHGMGYGIKADREDSGYTTLKSGLAANTFS